MVLWLLHRVRNTQKNTQEADEGEISAMPFAVGSMILAGLLHGNLNDRPLFDALWMCSLFIGAVAVLPQLWMMTHRRGSVPALTSHFVAVMAVSRVLSGMHTQRSHVNLGLEPSTIRAMPSWQLMQCI